MKTIFFFIIILIAFLAFIKIMKSISGKKNILEEKLFFAKFLYIYIFFFLI
jgi:hypothetical protein